MNSIPYSMSFTTGGLFYHESVKLAALYLEHRDWNIVRDRVLTENLLQARTINTSKRICREVISRLKSLTPSELDLLVQIIPQEQGYLLWLAVCRQYRFIAEFALEVIRERYITLKTDLKNEDFDSFFNKKSEWHAELDGIKPSSRIKLRQVLFKILREAGLLSSKNTIISAIFSKILLEVISQGNKRDLLFFPAFESELKGMPQ